MGKVILGMTMSIDGFINDHRGSVEALYPDLAALRETEPLKESILNTGAVVMGRNSYAMAEDPDWFAGNYEYQVPIFVLTHQAPNRHPKETETLSFTFVTDGIDSAIKRAKAGLADELHIDIMPMLFGGGLRPFEDIGAGQIQLERLAVMELPVGRTHLKFRIIK
jgi:dihydrofolate reductase